MKRKGQLLRVSPGSEISKTGLAIILCIAAGTAISQPVNDDLVNATVIAGSVANVSGSLSNATSEVGEPFLPYISSGQTAWWTWTAPSNGIVGVFVSAYTFSPLLTVYADAGPDGLSLEASNNYLACYESTNCGCHWRFRDGAVFHVAQGKNYKIALDSAIITDASWVFTPGDASNPMGTWAVVQTTNVLVGGDFWLNLNFTPAPANDDFANRIQLIGRRKEVLTSNAGATKEPGEPDHLGNPGGSSVWYSWTAPASGRVTLSTNKIPPYLPPQWYGSVDAFMLIGGNVAQLSQPDCGLEIDQDPPPKFYPVFAAYTGTSVDSLIAANCQSLSLDAYPNAVGFDVIKGETYQIAFEGNRGTTGAFLLSLALTKPASNDRFSKRIRTHGVWVVATGFNAGATHEAGEPSPMEGSTGKTVWWSWKPPVGGMASVDLTGSDYSFPVAVFSGSRLDTLQLIAEGSGSVSFEVEAKQTYQIAVSDAGGLTGAITFRAQVQPVEAVLSQVISRGGTKAVLSYDAAPGEKILLQRSADGTEWRNLRQAVAHDNGVQFLVRQAPASAGPFYRAFIVDHVGN